MYSLLLLASLALSSVLGASVNKEGVYYSCNRPGVFALTFDDGPYEYSWDLAKSLNQQGIQATFFINGKNWVNVEKDSVSTSDGKKTYMQVIKHYYDLGHQVASHTYQHVILKGASTKTIQKQMDKQANVIQKAIGKRPAVMRPPQGDIDSHAISVLRSMGYSIVIWDIDTSDWATHNFEFEKKAYTTVFEKSSMGHIALQHEVYDQTVHELVPWVIDYVKSKNMKFVTVSDCLGVSPYQS